MFKEEILLVQKGSLEVVGSTSQKRSTEKGETKHSGEEFQKKHGHRKRTRKKVSKTFYKFIVDVLQFRFGKVRPPTAKTLFFSTPETTIPFSRARLQYGTENQCHYHKT